MRLQGFGWRPSVKTTGAECNRGFRPLVFLVMATVKPELTRVESFRDLKPLLAPEGPCLSVYMPLSNASKAGLNPNAKQNELRWRDTVRIAETRAGQFGDKGRQLLDSIANWNTVAPAENVQPKSIAVFRCADMLNVVPLDSEVTERAVLAPHFYVRPLLPEFSRERRFYLLALSQKNTRLLFCSTHACEEVPLPPGTQTDFEEWMNQVKPDHTLVYNAATAPSSGGTVAMNALAPKGSDDEAKNEYLSHYFKQIDHGVAEALRGKSEPLVLCAVEYEMPLYRDVNSYPHLINEAVQGAPNGLKSGEMHARAFEALERDYQARVDDALAEWNHKAGGGASSRLKEVVTGAHDGRVLTLLVSDSMEKTGVFDESTHSVKGRETGTPEDEDLVNDAAVQTGAVVAAIFRF